MASNNYYCCSTTTTFLLTLVCAAVIMSSRASPQLQVLFIYPNYISDFGYTYAFETARITIGQQYAAQSQYNLTTTFLENVDPTTVPSILTTYINASYDMFILCGGQFAATAQQFAAQYPQLYFVGIGVLPATPNLAMITSRMDQWAFLNGIMCGLVTKTNRVGFFSTWVVPSDPYMLANGFWKGVNTVNPGALVFLSLSDSYFNDIEATYGVKQMAVAGMDCIATQQNIQTANQEADALNMISGGYSSDSRFQSGEYVFTSGVSVWAPIFEPLIVQALTNTWVPNNRIIAGFNQSSIALSWWSTIATQPQYDEMRKTVEAYMANFTTSAEERIFCGSLATELGYPMANESECMTVYDLMALNNVTRHLIRFANLTASNVITQVYVNWQSPYAIAIATLAAIAILVILMLMVHIWVRREHPVYVASSPFFMMVILCGSLLISISVLFWATYPGEATCMLRPWLGGIGWALILSSILAKTHRIYQIFQLNSLEVVAITNRQLLLKFVTAIVCAECVILVFWQALIPLQTATSLSVGGLAYNQVYAYCGNSSNSVLGVFLAFNIALMLPAIVVAWLAREVADKYNESTAVTYAAFLALIISIITITTSVIVADIMDAAYMVPTIGILVIQYSTVGFIFVPKLLYVHEFMTWTSQLATGSSGNSATKSTPQQPMTSSNSSGNVNVKQHATKRQHVTVV